MCLPRPPGPTTPGRPKDSATAAAQQNSEGSTAGERAGFLKDGQRQTVQECKRVTVLDICKLASTVQRRPGCKHRMLLGTAAKV